MMMTNHIWVYAPVDGYELCARCGVLTVGWCQGCREPVCRNCFDNEEVERG